MQLTVASSAERRRFRRACTSRRRKATGPTALRRPGSPDHDSSTQPEPARYSEVPPVMPDLTFGGGFRSRTGGAAEQ